ncbi:AAA family ATPase [Hymenobacter lucidus]|uniref:AAA family ATPase n=1 Tax=Hymenobacter lucidus TaxID=2880930 RepID=A0ABS8ALD8_9BACT|nr:ATP-binding protein [Hymenobacter lucidus]MCB2407020.1 AAA family ATPase [Hymenobacter lucidus]
MLIQSLHVSHFRGIRHLKLENLTNVNLLLGKNNVAKTSVLEALFLFAAANVEVWANKIDNERGLLGSDQGFAYLFYGFDSNQPIELGADIVVDEYVSGHLFDVHRYRLDVGVEAVSNPDSNSQWLTPKFSQLSTSLKQEYQTEGVNKIRVTVFSTEPSAKKPLSVTLSRRSYGHNTRVSTSRSGPNRSLINQSDFGQWLSTRMSFSDLYTRVEHLIVTKQDERLVEILRLIDHRIKSIALGSNDTIYFDLGGHLPTLLPLNLMGDGVQRLLSIIAALAIRPGAVVLIDEIDNGLHYSTLRVLWQAILSAAKEYKVQIIATTHSAEALRHLTGVLDDKQWADLRSTVAVYTLVKDDKDTIKSYRYDYEQLEFALEHDVEVRN